MRIAVGILGALIGTAMLAGGAAATPLGAASGVTAAANNGGSDIVQVQVGRRGGNRVGGRGGGRRGGGGGGGFNAGTAAAVGLGVAVIGGIIAAESARREQESQNAVSYCASRFRSYNPETGTYIGRGGQVMRCP